MSVRNPLTDNHGNYDAANIGFFAFVGGMLALGGWDVIGNHAGFKAQEFGMGVAAGIAALGAYRWGDSKSPPPKEGA